MIKLVLEIPEQRMWFNGNMSLDSLIIEIVLTWFLWSEIQCGESYITTSNYFSNVFSHFLLKNVSKIFTADTQELKKAISLLQVKITGSNAADNYMLKVNNRNTRKTCETCSKLIMTTF